MVPQQQAMPSGAVQALNQGTMVPARQALPSRPERPMSARRGPPKLPGTASAGQLLLCCALLAVPTQLWGVSQSFMPSVFPAVTYL